ncbi:MAG TPA: chromate efflux transporter [Longimicrobium sp.]|nr:chromate efflux transporter [Longimicrobium sp.]
MSAGDGRLALYFLRLGATGFGGPIVLVEHMRRDLVEERGWITPDEYRDGLALSQLAPGPLAAQLAVYLGWIRGGAAGATAAGFAFVAPSLAMVLALSVLYVRFGGLPWMAGAFYGVGAVVIAIIARSAFKFARGTIGRDRLLWTVCAANALTTAWTGTELMWVFLAGGAVVMLARGHRPRVRWPALVLVPPPVLAGAALHGQLLLFFTKASLVVFGSGLAVVPFLYGGVVQEYGWLNDRQFLDAVAVSMLTPGPVVITVAFIGYLVAGLAGALLAAAGMFIPTWLVVLALAPHFQRVRRHAAIGAFVEGITAAAAGAIAGAAYVLGTRAIVDAATTLIALGGLALLHRRIGAPEPVLILAGGVAGLLLSPG